MAKENENGQERSEQPTSKRLEESRKKGQVAKSMEVSTAFLFGAIVLSFYFYIPDVSDKLSGMMRAYLSNLMIWDGTSEGVVTIFRHAVLQLAGLLLPIMLVFLVIGVISNLAQVGFLFSGESIKPKFSKLNPIKGFKQKFMSVRTLQMFAKNIVILIIITLLAYRAIKREIPAFPPLMESELSVIVLTTFHAVMHLLWDSLWIFIIIAAADFAFQKWQHTQELMMSKEEVKEESKQSDGNPQVKSRIRSIQMQMARRRMMQEVPKADVVITNPTHLAIALKYDRGESIAPVVVAKGAGAVAEKIKEMARESSVPIVENKPVARALFKAADIGDMIPEELYKAVAEILAYVYRLKQGVA